MGFLDELKRLTHPYAEEEDLFKEEEESYRAPVTTSKSSLFDVDTPVTAERRRQAGSNTVVSISATTQLQVVLARPERLEQAA